MSFLRAGPWLVLAAAAAIVVHTLLSSEGWATRQRVHTELLELTDARVGVEDEVEKLRAQVAAFTSESLVQQRAIRNELGFVGEHELILNFATQTE